MRNKVNRHRSQSLLISILMPLVWVCSVSYLSAEEKLPAAAEEIPAAEPAPAEPEWPRSPEKIFSEKELEAAEKRSSLRDLTGTLSDAFRLTWSLQIPGLMNNMRSGYPDTAERHYFEAVMAYNAGNRLEALQSIEQSFKYNPDFDRSWNLKGLIFIDADRFKEAEAALRKAVGASPYNPFYVNNLANALYRTGNLPDALTYANLAVNYKPNFGEAFFLRGLIYKKQKNAELALKDFYEARYYGINSDDFIKEYMNLAASVNREELMVQLSEDLIKRGDADALRVNAALRVRYGEFDKARISLEKLLVRPEANAEDRKNYIYIMYKLNRNPMAVIARLSISDEEKAALSDHYSKLTDQTKLPEVRDPIVNPVPRK